MPQEIIKITGLNKSYAYGSDKVRVLKNVSLTVYKGEVLCLFGRSGSGKTTLLNLIGGLDSADSGEIFVNNKSYRSIPNKDFPKFRRKNIGFVFQYFNLIPYLSTIENVMLPLKYDGTPQKERREKAKNLLVKLGLEDRLNFPVYNLSGGQAQRVAFARASINNPSTILADEPTGYLDSQSGKELADLILTINKEEGKTFIISTHDQEMAKIAGRIMNIEDGEIIYK